MWKKKGEEGKGRRCFEEGGAKKELGLRGKRVEVEESVGGVKWGGLKDR